MFEKVKGILKSENLFSRLVDLSSIKDSSEKLKDK